ncbi:MAG: glycerophosphoryl diester phosphodiesterase membrane domain-containing protein [Eubacterium sp.]|nr:glycerophosphoryl diester phosphodiesterase membrane domain-containing protein [Eubacterium sp.]
MKKRSLVIMKFTDVFKKLWETIRFNLRPVLLFLILFSAVNYFVSYALASMFKSLIMSANGTTYIATSNMSGMLKNPLTWILIVICLILFVMIASFEISALVYAFSMGSAQKKVTLVEIINAGVMKWKDGIHPKNWGVAVFLLVLLPLSGFFPLYQDAFSTGLPEFIRDFINANNLLSTIIMIFCIVMVIVFLNSAFSLIIYNREGCSFSEAGKKSKAVIKGNRIRLLIALIVVIIITNAICYGLSGIASGFVNWLTSLTAGEDGGSISTAYTQLTTMRVIKTLLFTCFIPAVNLALLTVLYEMLSGSKEVKILKNGKKWSPAMTVLAAVIGVLVVSNIVVNKDTYSFMAEEPDRPQIIAHRGDSYRAPENSMPAFVLAAEEEADLVELDVHQTKDGVIIVSHDDDLTRVSGQSVFVHDLTYEEVSQLETGSWFSEEYRGLHLSTLDEVLKFFYDYPDIELIIEIKPSEFDHDIEQAVMDVITENDMKERSTIISLNYDTIANVKKLDPTFNTAYCMVIASGDLTTIDNTDDYSIEQGNITAEMVNKIHQADRRIFSWTSNTEETVQALVDLGVDGITTDNPIMMRNALDGASYSGGFEKLIRMFCTWIKGGL